MKHSPPYSSRETVNALKANFFALLCHVIRSTYDFVHVKAFINTLFNGYAIRKNEGMEGACFLFALYVPQLYIYIHNNPDNFTVDNSGIIYAENHSVWKHFMFI